MERALRGGVREYALDDGVGERDFGGGVGVRSLGGLLFLLRVEVEQHSLSYITVRDLAPTPLVPSPLWNAIRAK